jgi:hypothetical protein
MLKSLGLRIPWYVHPFQVGFADPAFHFHADPDPTFHFDAEPDQIFELDADPNVTVSHQ